jgi:hypothetical protein
MAAEGTWTMTPGGMYCPLERVMPLRTRRPNEAVQFSQFQTLMMICEVYTH